MQCTFSLSCAGNTMKKFTSVVLVLLCFCACAKAQWSYFDLKRHKSSTFDLTVGVGDRQGLIALTWQKLHPLGLKKRLYVGYGARGAMYFAGNQSFITAPARLSKGKAGPEAIFTPYKVENLDTVSFSKTGVFSANFTLFLLYSLSSRWDLCFNMDMFGFSLGSSRNGDFVSSLNNPAKTRVYGGPTNVNLMLTNDNNIGNLNSELVLRYWLNEQWALKFGYSLYFAEYRLDRKVLFNNDRFRNKSPMICLGLTFKSRTVRYR